MVEVSQEVRPLMDIRTQEAVEHIREDAAGGCFDAGDVQPLLTALSAAEARVLAAEARVERLEGALDCLVNAKALSGVRALVSGWNGENKDDGPYDRHPSRLGATLPKTNCGAVYDLDAAMIAARAALTGDDQ